MEDVVLLMPHLLMGVAIVTETVMHMATAVLTWLRFALVGWH